MTSETANRLKALAAALFWGVSFVATKAALREVQPLTIIVLRFGMGVLILFLAVWQAHLVRTVRGRDLFLVALLGAIGVAIHQGLQVTGLELTSASSMAWLVALNPVFTAILAWMFLSEVFGPLKILGLAIAFLGAIAVVTEGTLSPETLHLPSTTGDMLALASALNWAVFSVASKPLLGRLPPKLMMAYVMLIGWLMVLPFWGVGHGWNEISHLTATGWVAIGFLGVFCSGVAYIFWYDALAEIDASQAAAFIYIEPLVTVVVAAMVLSEAFTLATILGGLTILVGVYLVNRPAVRATVSEVPAAGD
jgi:drug/metabolite transporter (DMT)-like permease